MESVLELRCELEQMVMIKEIMFGGLLVALMECIILINVYE